MFFLSVDWNPTTNESVLSRYPTGLVYTSSVAEQQTLDRITPLLRVIYWATSARLPTTEEVENNQRASRLEREIKTALKSLSTTVSPTLIQEEQSITFQCGGFTMRFLLETESDAILSPDTITHKEHGTFRMEYTPENETVPHDVLTPDCMRVLADYYQDFVHMALQIPWVRTHYSRYMSNW